METDRRTTVHVASANTLVVRGLIELLRTVEKLVVTGSAHEPSAVALGLLEQQPDMVILDAAMIEPLQGLLGPTHKYPRVLVLGSKSHVGTLPVFGSQDACGYLSERGMPEKLVSIIRQVAKCDVTRADRDSCHRCPVQNSLQLPHLPLTGREYEVFVRIGWGQGVSRLATELGISVKTIETHREAIKRKLGLTSATALLGAALEWRSGELVSTRPGGSDEVPREIRRRPSCSHLPTCSCVPA